MSYWEDRFKQLEKVTHSYGQKVFREIEDVFRDAEIKIQKEIEAWYGRFAKNNDMTMLEAKKLLNTKELEEFKWDVNKYIDIGRENALNQKWMKELENASSRFHVNRLEALKVRVQQIGEVAFQNQLDIVDDMANKVFKDNYYHTIFEVQKGFNVGFNVGEIDERRIKNIIYKPWTNDGENFSERIWKNKNKLINEVHKELSQTILLGESPNRAIKNIVKKMNTNRVNASRLVMTELAYFHTISQQEAFKELDAEEYEILAVLDSKTSPICQDFDGQVFKLKDMKVGVNAPPFHPNCRSIIIPYYDDYGVGERIAKDKDGKTYYVPADMKYKDWKRKFIDNDGLADDKNDINTGKIYKVKTYEEAKEALVSKVGFKMVEESFNKIDKELAIENTNQLIVLEEKFGVIHQSISTICSVSDGNAMAYVSSRVSSPMNQNLSLCPGYYLDKGVHIKNLLNEREIRFSMPFLDEEASIYTVTHEYGHMLQNMIVRNRMIEKGWSESNSRQFVDFTKRTKKAMFKWYHDIRKSVENKCVDEILKIAKEIDNDFNIRDNISTYSKENEAEFFAEVFANSQLGKPNILGKAMQIWLERNGLVK